MNQYQNSPAWGGYYQEADQQAPFVAPNGATQWQPGQLYPMQQWNVAPQPLSQQYQYPAQQYQYTGPQYQTQNPYWMPQEAGGGEQSYQQTPQWQAPAVNGQAYEVVVAEEDGYEPAGFDFSVGGFIFALFIAGFLVWFGWRHKSQAVDESAAPITRDDRRMLSLADELNKLVSKP